MPRDYKCKKCGVAHAPPTGKHCRAMLEAEPEQRDNGHAELLAVFERSFAKVTEKIDDLDKRMRTVEHPQTTGDNKVTTDPQGSAAQATQPEPTGSELNVEATPDTNRRDALIMAQAAERIAQIQLGGRDFLDDDDFSRNRTQGRRSGASMLASDVVKQRIDWPHLYVQRLSEGNTISVPYSDLRVEEFVYGFLEMLDAPKCSMDQQKMRDLLKMIMRDAMDFSWSNALRFYRMVGWAVEKGALKWSDSEKISDMRMTFSRANFPEKKEVKETPKTTNTNTKTAPSGMRCCATYQRRSCEQNRDHHPFTHACSHCFKTCNMLFRHPEADCIRKLADEAKNAKRGE